MYWKKLNLTSKMVFEGTNRLEEHLPTAKNVVDKTLLGDWPVWIVRLDLSKHFRLGGLEYAFAKLAT